MTAFKPCLGLLAILLSAGLLVNAQSTSDESHRKKVNDVTVMGCLVQGSQPGEYVIKGEDKTYVLKGHQKDLEKHVGQMVSISGSMKETSAPGSTPEIERFKVSSLAKTNSTCP